MDKKSIEVGFLLVFHMYLPCYYQSSLFVYTSLLGGMYAHGYNKWQIYFIKN